MIDFALQAEQIEQAADAAQALLDKLALPDEHRADMQRSLDQNRETARKARALGALALDDDAEDEAARRLSASGYETLEALREWTEAMQMLYDRIPAFRR